MTELISKLYKECDDLYNSIIEYEKRIEELSEGDFYTKELYSKKIISGYERLKTLSETLNNFAQAELALKLMNVKQEK